MDPSSNPVRDHVTVRRTKQPGLPAQSLTELPLFSSCLGLPAVAPAALQVQSLLSLHRSYPNQEAQLLWLAELIMGTHPLHPAHDADKVRNWHWTWSQKEPCPDPALPQEPQFPISTSLRCMLWRLEKEHGKELISGPSKV